MESYESLCDTLSAVTRVLNTSIFVYDFTTNQMVYKSKKQIFVEISDEGDKLRDSSNPYWSSVIKEDVRILEGIRDAWFLLLKSFSEEQKNNHTLVVNSRIQVRQRPYMITQKITPLSLTSKGELKMGLFNVTVSPYKNWDNVSALVIGKNFYLIYDHDNKTFCELDYKYKITPIEKSIIQLYLSGLTNLQIAEELRVSVNTIKTHKRIIFKKLNVTCFNELILKINIYDLY